MENTEAKVIPTQLEFLFLTLFIMHTNYSSKCWRRAHDEDEGWWLLNKHTLTCTEIKKEKKGSVLAACAELCLEPEQPQMLFALSFTYQKKKEPFPCSHIWVTIQNLHLNYAIPDVCMRVCLCVCALPALGNRSLNTRVIQSHPEV